MDNPHDSLVDIPVVIHGSRELLESLIEDPGWQFEENGELVLHGRLSFVGEEHLLWIDGGLPFGHELNVELGPPKSGWTEYQRGFVHAWCLAPNDTGAENQTRLLGWTYPWPERVKERPHEITMGRLRGVLNAREWTRLQQISMLTKLTREIARALE